MATVITKVNRQEQVTANWVFGGPAVASGAVTISGGGLTVAGPLSVTMVSGGGMPTLSGAHNRAVPINVNGSVVGYIKVWPVAP